MKFIHRILLAAVLAFTGIVHAQNVSLPGEYIQFGGIGVGTPPSGVTGQIAYPAGQGLFGDASGTIACTGCVGQVVTSTVPVASVVSLTTATPANMTSLSIPAGDWDLWALVDHNLAASTSVTILSCSLSLTSATMNTQPGGSGIGTDPLTVFRTAANVMGGVVVTEVGPVQVQFTTATTVYVVCNDTFTVSTDGAFGTLYARRRR